MSPERARALTAVADRLNGRRSPDGVLRVAVDGRTASDKTTLADELAPILGRRGPVIRTGVDGFHRPRRERWARGRTSALGYYEDARDYGAVRRLLLDPLGPGGDRRYRLATFDLERDEPLETETVTAPPGAILLVDGSFLQRPEFEIAWDFVLFVRAEAETAVARGAARDAAALGGTEAAEALHRERYGGAWVLYESGCGPEARADAVWDNEDVLRPRVSFR